mgnify:FL=1
MDYAPEQSAYDDRHDQVPTVMPPENLGDVCQFCGKAFSDEPQPEQASGVDPERFIDALLTGAASAAEVGERLLLLACCLNQAGADIQAAPRGSRQLALWLDVSHVTAAARLNGFKADFIEQFAHCLNNRPYR